MYFDFNQLTSAASGILLRVTVKVSIDKAYLGNTFAGKHFNGCYTSYLQSLSFYVLLVPLV